MVYMYHSFLIHLSADGHLGYFHALAIINSAGAGVLISWLQSPSTVILEPRKIKSATVSPSICHEVMGLDAMILVF